MRLGLVFLSVVASVAIAACTTNSGGGGSSGSSGSPVTPPADASATGDSAAPGDGGTPVTTPPPSTNEAEIDIDGTCSAFKACGGSPQGTYDYASGCIADVFADARAKCPALDTTNAKVKVTGSLHFTPPALTRDAIVKISGSITLPATCAMGQCAVVEAALKGTFDSVSCTGSSACTCTISDTNTVKSATTFSVSGNTLTTADGDAYDICAEAGALGYSGKSLGSEDGVWQLTKR